MEIDEILQHFERASGVFERAALEAAVARREEIVPGLLRILEETLGRAAQIDDPDYMGHLYAMFLLAQFREKRAYPLVVRFALLPGDIQESLCGDLITSYLGSILASVWDGELGPIQAVIENEDADQWARGTALSSLVTLVATGQKDRDEIVGYLASLFRGKLVREWSYVWDALVSFSSALYPAELMDDIEQAYEQELVDSSFIDIDDVRGDLATGKDLVLARLSDDHHLIDDTIEEMKWWSCFEQRREIPQSLEPLSQPKASATAGPVAQVKRTAPKTGRNDPCPCGSGKKYKKCCGA